MYYNITIKKMSSKIEALEALKGALKFNIKTK